MLELGCEYKDKITGFRGIATGYVEYISGCNQALLAPKIKEDGEFVKSHWLDEQRLHKIKSKKINLENGKSPGFDKQAPVR